MAKRVMLAIVVVFVALVALSMVVHGGVLRKSYADNAGLFRPEPEMSVALSLLVTLVIAACFVSAYALFVGRKSAVAGLGFGLLWGVSAGASMGFGSYSAMPIPLSMAVVWCAGPIAWFAVAGLLTGLIVKPCACGCKSETPAA